MCGIAGFLGGHFSGLERTHIIETMIDTLYHRGPDSGSVWASTSQGIALGHRSLAIVYLSICSWRTTDALRIQTIFDRI